MNTLTEKETAVATLFAEESLDTCGAFYEDENLSYMNAEDIAEATGLNLQQVGGIMSSLIEKMLIVDCKESYRGAHINDFMGNTSAYLKYDELKHLVTE